GVNELLLEGAMGVNTGALPQGVHGTGEKIAQAARPRRAVGVDDIGEQEMLRARIASEVDLHFRFRSWPHEHVAEAGECGVEYRSEGGARPVGRRPAGAAPDMLGQMRSRPRLAAHAAGDVVDADEGKRFAMHAVVSPATTLARAA